MKTKNFGPSSSVYGTKHVSEPMLLSSSFLLLPACSRACFGHPPSSQFATEDSDPQFASCRRGGPPPPVHGAAAAEACRPGASPPPVRRGPLRTRSAALPQRSPSAPSPPPAPPIELRRCAGRPHRARGALPAHGADGVEVGRPVRSISRDRAIPNLGLIFSP